jgi:hypothetical protein
MGAIAETAAALLDLERSRERSETSRWMAEPGGSAIGSCTRFGGSLSSLRFMLTHIEEAKGKNGAISLLPCNKNKTG